MRVYVPGPLRSYTGEKSEVQAEGVTLADVLRDLDRQFPGVRFRMINEQDQIREHIKLFVNQEQAKRLDVPVKTGDVVQIICALSGG